MNTKYKPLAVDNNDVIHGIINSLAVCGQGVALNPSNTGELILATGVRPYHIERDVKAEISLEEHVFMPNILTPVKLGTEVSARRVTQLEVEGADYIVKSGTGAITTGTAAHTELGMTDGKYRVKQSGDELAGRLRAQLTPEEDGDVRILVEAV